MFNEKLVKTAKALTAYCQTEQEAKALDELYAQDCVSVEALDMPGEPMGREASGLDAIRAKHDWWFANNEVHSTSAEGPFLHGDDTFSLIFEMDVTDKNSGERVQMKEVGLYTTNADGQIIREAFFYPPFE
ncbi:SnoaL-like domain-containing protein [Litorimonas sp. WD9-15]|uniref:SnoaL-like domain-containing protein n=1 Tax=Litorimonas sp. WD9-15 TaxID=3418716 RepID=UPI003D007D9F